MGQGALSKPAVQLWLSLNSSNGGQLSLSPGGRGRQAQFGIGVPGRRSAALERISQ